MLIILFVLSAVLHGVESHSWLHCVNYAGASLKVDSIQNNLCSAFPRGVTPATIFGNDVGLDFIANNNNACKQGPGTLIKMKKSTNYRLLWPAKNHKAAVCTNPFIPDRQLKLFLIPGKITDKDPPLSVWTRPEFLIKDFKANGGSGFQNCPDFCPQTDRVPCAGDFQFPATLADGQYKALWLWEFNPGQIYTHCFDVDLGAVSNLPNPTSNPTLKPSSVLTPSLPPNTCISQYLQCGGKLFTGNTNCCSPLICKKWNDYYSQCLVS